MLLMNMTTSLSRRDWLKASAAGVIGSVAHLASTGNVQAHDHFQRPGLDFTLQDVRIVKGPATGFLFFHPRTGRFTTQNERRAMVEIRTNVGIWRAIRNAKRMAAEGPDNLRESVSVHVDKAISTTIK